MRSTDRVAAGPPEGSSGRLSSASPTASAPSTVFRAVSVSWIQPCGLVADVERPHVAEEPRDVVRADAVAAEDDEAVDAHGDGAVRRAPAACARWATARAAPSARDGVEDPRVAEHLAAKAAAAETRAARRRRTRSRARAALPAALPSSSPRRRSAAAAADRPPHHAPVVEHEGSSAFVDAAAVGARAAEHVHRAHAGGEQVAAPRPPGAALATPGSAPSVGRTYCRLGVRVEAERSRAPWRLTPPYNTRPAPSAHVEWCVRGNGWMRPEPCGWTSQRPLQTSTRGCPRAPTSCRSRSTRRARRPPPRCSRSRAAPARRSRSSC